MPAATSTAILLAHGPLRERVSAELTGSVYRNGGVIVAHDQYVDHERGHYFTRLEWRLAGSRTARTSLEGALAETLHPLGLSFALYFSDDLPKIALFVSNLSHCLYDILGRWRSREWRIDVPVIVSNKTALADVARRFDVEFRHFPITPESKAEQERKQIALLRERGVELIVLARYMQVLGPEITAAFPGAKPYHAAYRRGVKIIGATSHYVTEDLDAGPIIEQDVIRVGHATPVAEMIRVGRDLEKVVLARAIWAHLQRKVIVDEARTVVFA